MTVRWMQWAALMLALACVPATIRTIASIPAHAPLDYNEGWMAYHAQSVSVGRPLYPTPPRFFINNYPPLSFYVLAAIGRASGDPIAAGRALALATFVIVTLLLVRSARLMNCTAAEAWFGGGLFAAHVLAFSNYAGINDPQFLAHAIAGAGLLAILPAPNSPSTLNEDQIAERGARRARRDDREYREYLREEQRRQPGCPAREVVLDQRGRATRTGRRIAAGGALLALALFVKPNVAALPIAAIVWLLATDPRSAWRLLAVFMACAAAGLIACIAAYGPEFVHQLSMPRAYSLHVSETESLRWLVQRVWFAGVLGFVIWKRERDSHLLLCAIYALISTAVGLTFLGGIGISRNVLFESDWAWSLSAAVCLNRMARSGAAVANRARAMLICGYVALPIVTAATLARPEWRSAAYWVAPRKDASIDAGRDVRFLAERPGAVFCETLALCFWAGAPPEVDLFTWGYRVHLGISRPEDLEDLLAAHYFAVVQLEPPGRIDSRFYDALARGYRLHHVDRYGSFLVPRTPGE
jgi:hypothetical protein